jgi:hypothetical protein
MATKKHTRTEKPGAGQYTPPNRVQKAVVSAGIGLLALAAAASPVLAEAQPGLRWKPIKDTKGRVVDDHHLAGVIHLRAQASSDHRVEGWTLDVLAPAGADGPGFGTVCEARFDPPQTAFDVDCEWDTTTYPDRHPSANQPYLVRLSTLEGKTATPVGPDREVALDNPASAPGHVRLAFDEKSGRVTLTWKANPEPDVVAYVVEEQVDSGPWTKVGELTGTRFERTLTEPGTYRYRVAARRHGPDGKPGDPGPWGFVASSPRQATVRRDATEAAPGGGEQTSPRPRQTAPAHGESSKPDTGGRRAPAGPPPASPRGTEPSRQPGDDPSPAVDAGTPRPPASTASDASHGPSFGFSTASNEAPSSLHARRPDLLAGTKRPVDFLAAAPAPVRSPVPSPPLVAESDPGYQERLPFPDPDPEPAEACPATMGQPSELLSSAPRPGRGHRRLVALGLFAAAGGLLAVALHPRRKPRRGLQATSPAPDVGATGERPVFEPPAAESETSLVAGQLGRPAAGGGWEPAVSDLWLS